MRINGLGKLARASTGFTGAGKHSPISFLRLPIPNQWLGEVDSAASTGFTGAGQLKSYFPLPKQIPTASILASSLQEFTAIGARWHLPSAPPALVR